MTRTEVLPHDNRGSIAIAGHEIVSETNKPSSFLPNNSDTVKSTDNAEKVEGLKQKLEVDQILREQFPSPASSPEPTTILGMMSKFNKSVQFGEEVTSFAPRSESTRMINFKIPPR